MSEQSSKPLRHSAQIMDHFCTLPLNLRIAAFSDRTVPGFIRCG
jgi:hypothetical protein